MLVYRTQRSVENAHMMLSEQSCINILEELHYKVEKEIQGKKKSSRTRDTRSTKRRKFYS